MDEEWRIVPGFDAYEVSNLGRLRSWRQQGPGKSFRRKTPKILKPKTGWGGYAQVGIRKDGDSRRYHRLVHRLVASAFLERGYHHAEVNHKDFNKQNNCVENLEWVTRQENQDHMEEHGRRPSGDEHPNRQFPKRLPHGDDHFLKNHPEKVKRGMAHTNARLTDDAVRDIRVRYAKGDISCRVLGEEYGVTLHCIHRIVTRKTWKHID